MDFRTILLLVFLFHQCSCVEVHFEAADSGFFLKHTRQPPVAPEISNIQSSASTTKSRIAFDSVLSVDRFTVVQTTEPVSIRASYGPFSTKQTVPARYIVPDAMENQSDYLNNTTAALMELQQSNVHLDISAHLVRGSVPQDSPVLRVLFHAGADPSGHLQKQKICVLLHVSMGAHSPLKGRCMPEGEDGVCVAEVVIPSNWWPALPPPSKNNPNVMPLKAPQRYVQVSYSVFEPPARNPEQCEPKIQIQPLTAFAQVALVPAIMSFKEIRADETLAILMPQRPLYSMSKFHVPVFLFQSSKQKIVAFTIRARVKSGVKILGAAASSDMWNISMEKENPKHTTARVTAYYKEQDENGKNKSFESGDNITSVLEVFSWLLEVGDSSKEPLDDGKIVWSVTYVFENSKMKDILPESVAIDETKKRMIAKLEINKDDIQAVLPMAKNWELMNTAVLTGRQVAQAMKVFIVSQAGKVADVTLQSSCHAEDESVIKVSSSCSSVYVDGSEIRGSSNASVIVKYGTYVGIAKFVVWMPEFPLEVYISDFRLSQVKGWKVIDDTHYLHNKQSQRRKKRSYVWGQHITGFYNNVGPEKLICRARYQQSPVEVYARFLAINQNSGRISYFISRRTGLRVTDLVQPLLRVADPKIATLKGRILQGKSMGRTDVQVLSPITGRVIGAKEVRVGSDKVSLSKLIVRVVSGLQLTISPDSSIENGYIAETSVTHKLTAQYQEGLLDIDLEFSDGSRTPLRDVSVEDYFLLVESLDTEVVAFAPMLASHHPRVIAVGEGNGNLLRITLLLSEDCRARRNSLPPKQTKSNIVPLASALANVEVDFNYADSGSKHEAVQNDGIVGRDRRKSYHNNDDLADIIVGIPLKDASHHHETAIQGRQYRGNVHSINKLAYGKKSIRDDMTPMEVGMYVLLTAFCCAIVIFVISCVVYASKFKPITIESGFDSLETSKGNFSANILLREARLAKEPTTNAHDWVWLGRSTLDRTSAMTDLANEKGHGYPRDSRVRITSNPILNLPNCSNSQKCSSFHKYNYNSNRVENSSCNGPNITEKSADYRPPIPPHRNIGVRSLVNNSGNFSNAYLNAEQRHDSHRQHKNENGEQVHIAQIEIPKPELSLMVQDQQHQLMENKQKQPSPKQIFLPEEINPGLDNKSTYDKMHNAEILVENTNNQQGDAFKFDSLTPKLINASKPHSSNSQPIDYKRRAPVNKSGNVNVASLDETVAFVTPGSKSKASKRAVKRATIVGNPMFSTSGEHDIAPGESLSLDDLDMDYEQIMHYFDNLKESNA